MDSRVSATGLKSVELDELTTNQINLNNEGLQYFHKYNIFLPTVTEGYYSLQEELDNIMILYYLSLSSLLVYFKLYQMSKN